MRYSAIGHSGGTPRRAGVVVIGELLDEENSGRFIWADSAYRSREREAALREAGCQSRIHHKGQRNRKLNKQKQ